MHIALRAGQPQIDSLENSLNSSSPDSAKAVALNKLSAHYRGTNPIKSLRFTNEALRISKELNLSGIQATAYSGLGIIAHNQGNYRRALEHYRLALAIRTKAGDSLAVSASYANIGNAYMYEGAYVKALDYHLRSLRIIQHFGDSSSLDVPFTNIGAVYYYHGDLDMAITFFRKSLVIEKQFGGGEDMTGTYNNIGGIYAEMGVKDSALAYFDKALRNNEESNDLKAMSASFINIGALYYNLGEISKAITYYNKALDIDLELNNEHGMSMCYFNIGEAFEYQGNRELAIQYYLKSMRKSTDIGHLYSMQDVHKKLSNMYATDGEYEKAFASFKLHLILKDSLFNDQKSKELGRLEAKHEFGQTAFEEERAIEELTKNKKLHQMRRDNIQYSGILLLVLCLFGAVFVTRRFNVSPKTAEGLIFFTFLLFFEFCLVILDPYIDRWSSGEPIYKLLFNSGIVALIFPLHAFFETILKGRLVKG